MAKIEILKQDDHLKVAVLDSNDVLVGYGFVGPDGAGGYQINRVESWAGPTSKVSIKGNILRHLSVAKFNRINAN